MRRFPRRKFVRAIPPFSGAILLLGSFASPKSHGKNWDGSTDVQGAEGRRLFLWRPAPSESRWRNAIRLWRPLWTVPSSQREPSCQTEGPATRYAPLIIANSARAHTTCFAGDLRMLYPSTNYRWRFTVFTSMMRPSVTSTL